MAARDAYELFDDCDLEQDGTEGHRELRNPERKRHHPGRDVAELVGVHDELHREASEACAENREHAQAPEFGQPPRPWGEPAEKQVDPDVAAAAERVGE